MRKDEMTSKQMDALQALATALDGFIQAFGQNYPKKTAEVENFSTDIQGWAASNPVSE